MTNTKQRIDRPVTTVIYRPNSEVAGVRLVQDDAARVTVLALPFSEIPRLAGKQILDRGRSLTNASTYMLSDGTQAYFGESGNTLVRLARHFNDPDKRFATEVFVVSSFDDMLDKSAVIYMQRSFSDAAKRAGLMHIVEGTPPQARQLAAPRAAAIERMIEDAYPLLFDAGFRAFHSSNPSVLDRLGLTTGSGDLPAGSPDEIENTAIEIGAITAPDAVAEYQLTYGNVWAHGYAYPDRFILGPGSDVRSQINQSTNPIYQVRRKQLLDCGALVPIADLSDRLRLVVPVAVGSASVAAKLATGAHVNSRIWKLRPRGTVA